MGEVTRRDHTLQAKFRDGFGQGASEAGRLSDRGEVVQSFLGYSGVNDARGDGFYAQARDGRQRKTAHGLSGEMGRELSDGERVNALAARTIRADGKFVRSRSGGRDYQDFAVRGLPGQEFGGAVQKCGVGA